MHSVRPSASVLPLITACVFALMPLRAEAQSVIPAQRFDTTLDALPPLTEEDWNYLAENPDRLQPSELNHLAPVLGLIEVDNAIARTGPAPEALRVIAWNIERGRRWREAVQLIQSHPALQHPDIVLLSEMDLGMARSGNDHTTREMAKALGLNYAFAIEYVELGGGDSAERELYGTGRTHGYHGNAVLARYPLHNVRALRFPGIERWYGSDQHRLGGRVAVFADLTVDGTTVTLVSTHYESGLAEHAARELESRMVLAELRASGNPQQVIFGGDLNTIHTRPAVLRFREAGFEVDRVNLLDSPTSQRLKDGKVTRVGAHIDYILTRGFEPVRSEHSPAVVMAAYPNTPAGTYIGDHAAIAVELVPDRRP